MPVTIQPDGKFVITIDSIIDGIADSVFFAGDNQYDTAIGLDLDTPMSSYTDLGMLTPTSFVNFAGAPLNGTPYWLISASLGTESLYAYTNNGNLVTYDNALANEMTILTTGGTGGRAARGAAYYNNYIYLCYGSSEARTAEIGRYGPLSSTASYQPSWWASTLGKSALDDSFAYPTMNTISLPSHPMHVHSDGRLYIGDYDSSSTTASSRGLGMIHYIETEAFEGDGGVSDKSSTYNAYTLPPGYMPVDIESYGTDLVILAVSDSTNIIFKSQPAALFFWDTISKRHHKQVNLSDPAASALLYHNGKLYIWSGSYSPGCRLSVYLGGNEVKQIKFISYINMPYAGAVDALGNRVFWGTKIILPEPAAGVFALGYKDRESNAVHCIITSDAGGTGSITSLKRMLMGSMNTTDLIYGWVQGSSYGLDKRSSGNPNTAAFRSRAFRFGRPFMVEKVVILLGKAVTSAHTLIGSFLGSLDIDSTSNNVPMSSVGTTTYDLTTINNTNFPGARRVVLEPSYEGFNDFIFQLRWTGTTELPVMFPIIIEGRLLNQRTR